MKSTVKRTTVLDNSRGVAENESVENERSLKDTDMAVTDTSDDSSPATDSGTGSTHRTHPAWLAGAQAVVGLTALLTLVLVAFVWPATNLAPRDLPVGLAAPDPVAAQIEQGLSKGAEGALAITRVADRAEAERMIRDREIYGAIIVDSSGGSVLTASAASPAVAQLLGQLASNLGQAFGQQLQVVDVVPLPADDPRGAGLAAAALPLVLGAVAAAALLTGVLPGTVARLVGVVSLAVLAGLAMTAVLQFWLGSLEGSYWANAGVLALAIAASATVLLGLERLLGYAGLGIGAAVLLLLGNPLSGLNAAPELLPAGWGQLGQLLPPGAAGTALRSVAFFDGAGAGHALVVLLCWLGVGIVLSLLPRFRRPAHEGDQVGQA
jgi:hypothetical protein